MRYIISMAVGLVILTSCANRDEGFFYHPMLILAPKVFIVFFDSSSADLTSEAVAIIRESVVRMKDGHFRQMRVTGHTDTVGSRDYNQALSERRAMAVRAEVVRLGIRPEQTAVAGKAFNDQMVVTGPNTPHPENRRAVIELAE